MALTFLLSLMCECLRKVCHHHRSRLSTRLHYWNYIAIFPFWCLYGARPFFSAFFLGCLGKYGFMCGSLATVVFNALQRVRLLNCFPFFLCAISARASQFQCKSNFRPFTFRSRCVLALYTFPWKMVIIEWKTHIARATFFRLCSPSAVNKASRIVSRAIPLPAKTFIYWIGYGPCENSQRRTFLSLGSFLSEKEIIIITRHGEKRETHKFFCARLCVYDAGRYVVIIAQNASLMFTIIIFDDTDMYYSLHEKHNNSLFF